MDRALAQTIGLAALTAMLTVFVSRVDSEPVEREAAGTLAADTAVTEPTVNVKWLDDGNVLALVGAMNARHVAAADIMLVSAHVDTVQALAASLKRDHVQFQHEADSLAELLRIVPAQPAMMARLAREFQTQIDSMLGNHGAALDSAYVDQQVSSHKLMATYLDQLGGVVTQPELRTWIAATRERVGTQVTRIQAQQRALAITDSIVADSLAKRAAARAKRSSR